MVKRFQNSFWNWVSMLFTASTRIRPSPAAGDQFADEDARFKGLTQTDRVGDEDALPWLLQCLPSRVELIGHQVHRRAVAHVNPVVARRRLAKLALHVQTAVREPWGPVGHQPRRSRIQHLHLRLQGREKHGLLLPNQLGDAVADELVAPVRGPVDPPHHPLGIPDHDPRAGGQDWRAAIRHVVAGPRRIKQSGVA